MSDHTSEVERAASEQSMALLIQGFNALVVVQQRHLFHRHCVSGDRVHFACRRLKQGCDMRLIECGGQCKLSTGEHNHRPCPLGYAKYLTYARHLPRAESGQQPHSHFHRLLAVNEVYKRQRRTRRTSTGCRSLNVQDKPLPRWIQRPASADSLPLSDDSGSTSTLCSSQQTVLSVSTDSSVDSLRPPADTPTVHALGTQLTAEVNIPNQTLRVLLLTSPDALHRLCQASDLYLDGSFRLQCDGFAQLYVLYARTGRLLLPAAYAVLSDRSADTYTQVWSLLQRRLDACGLLLRPRSIAMDFEPDMLEAVRSAFPASRLRGCGFYFRRAIFEQAEALELQERYGTTGLFPELLDRLSALHQAPADTVRPLYEQLVRQFHAKCVGRPVAFRKFERFMETSFLAENSRFPPSFWLQPEPYQPDPMDCASEVRKALERQASDQPITLSKMIEMVHQFNQQSEALSLLAMCMG